MIWSLKKADHGGGKKQLFNLRAILKIIDRPINGRGMKVNLKAYLFGEKNESFPNRILDPWNSNQAAPQENSFHKSENRYLSHAYEKESFGTWGARPCTVPGGTELQIHRPYVLSKGSGNDPS